jgi:hypothetical protein
MGGQFVFGTLQATLASELTVPADSSVNALPSKCVGIWVGGAGDLEVSLIGDPDSYVTIVGVPAGTFVQGRFANFKGSVAGTTATSLVALSVGGNWRGL